MGAKFDLAAVMTQRAAAIPEGRTIETITGEILDLKQTAGNAILGIGQRLIEAKEVLSHGEWLPWLEEKVDFSERTAQNFMKLARSYSNPQTLADLGAAKALTLLALPEGEREEFVAEVHTVNGAEKTTAELSARELAQAIRDREQALAEKEAAEQARAKMEGDMEAANRLLEAARQEGDSAADRADKLRRELEELRARPIEVVGAAVPDEAALEAARAEGAEAARKEAQEKLRAKLDKAQTERKAAADRLKEAQEAAKEKERAIAQERDLLKERAAELERKLKVTGNQDMATFKVYFDATQENFNRMLGCLAKIKGTGSAEDHDKLVDALASLVQALGQKVPGKAGGQDA